MKSGPTLNPTAAVSVTANDGDASNSDRSSSHNDSSINERILMIILIVSALVFVLIAFGCYRYKRNGELKRKEGLAIGSIDFV